MKSVYILQNVEVESAGSITGFLDKQKMPYQMVQTYNSGELPDASQCEAVINLGCPISISAYRQHDYLKRLYQFVSSTVRRNVPYFGICFGGQLLAHVMGARVTANPVKEIGCYQVRLSKAGKDDPLFAGFPDSFSTLQWHSDTFAIPTGSEVLASSEDCKNQAFRSGNQVAVQFHLEATPDDLPRWCDAYSDELEQIGRTKQQMIDDYHAIQTTARELNDRLLENFFNLTS